MKPRYDLAVVCYRGDAADEWVQGGSRSFASGTPDWHQLGVRSVFGSGRGLPVCTPAAHSSAAGRHGGVQPWQWKTHASSESGAGCRRADAMGS